jgi:hypothetical protein
MRSGRFRSDAEACPCVASACSKSTTEHPDLAARARVAGTDLYRGVTPRDVATLAGTHGQA